MCGVKADNSDPHVVGQGSSLILPSPVQLWESTVSNNDSVTLSIPKSHIKKERKTIMARAPMVTRELIGTEAKVLTVDVEKAVTNYADITVQGKYKTAENLLKAIKKVYETPALQIVKVVEFHEVHKLYGMPCAEFYKNSVELDTETRKPLPVEK